MRLNLVPQETFFFRDARPFDQGEGWAGGIFPPLPSTFYGACRTAAISQKTTLADYYGPENNAVREEMGSPESLGSFRLRSLLPWSVGSPLVPMPLDLVESRSDGRLYSLTPFSETIVSDRPHALYHAERPDEREIPTVPWLSGHKLLTYLRGEDRIEAFRESRVPVVIESKTGIRRDRRLGTAEEHMLYNQDMLRFRPDFSFSMEVENAACLDSRGLLRIGHDGGLFAYSRHGGERHFDLVRNSGFQDLFCRHLETDGRFRLLFTSPAILAGGWLPGEVCDDQIWCINGITLKIESVVLGRPMRIGGWDWKKRRAKPLYRALPPGSVYYCRLLDGNPDALFTLFFDSNYCDQFTDLARQGFGHVLLGIRNQ